ncbi:MAG: DNA polymerase III subunit beta [Gammaproteobacteria bacterium]|nr:DNA polymerase III subunit beta [Gammaproteobacteria bacterium]
MKLSIQRDDLLKPLQQIIGAVEKRQTMPALSNVLIQCDAQSISLTATDLEIELVSTINQMTDEPGETTLPAKKLLDICKSLSDGANVSISIDKDKAIVKSSRSRFSLATLPASDFPSLEELTPIVSFSITQTQFKSVIEKTAFAMAQQDVRYYLNGLLFDLNAEGIRSIATDGHRLSYSEQLAGLDITENMQVIVPRKGILELSRLLQHNDDVVEIAIAKNHIRVKIDNIIFTSKLIDGRFPDYTRVIPEKGDNLLVIDRNEFKQALVRASILSNEKFRGIRLLLNNAVIKLQSHNPDHEEADVELVADYQGDDIEIGFNVNYMLDVLNASSSELVHISLQDSNSSCLVQYPDDEHSKYVIMPMRL